ncbi:MAG: universal stress protein [Desulfobulbaceae bacterium]|nr:universal stress protein [Desulfobulbaceae bacterium]
MECVSDTLLGQVKTLLLATDGSHFSEGALQEAFFFSQTCLAKLIVLHVVPTQSESVRAANFAVRKSQEALAPYFEHIRAMAQESSADLEIVVVGSDSPEKAVVEQARLRNADIILMGRHGKTDPLSRLVGKITTGVVAQGFPRVLVVPKEATLIGEHVLVGVNESPNGREAASVAISLSRQSKTFQKMTLISVLRKEDRREEIEKLVQNCCEQARTEGQISACEALVVVGETAQSIVAAAKERQVDMIIVGGHGKTRLTKFLLGHATENIIGQAHCPVLVVTAQEGADDQLSDSTDAKP